MLRTYDILQPLSPVQTLDRVAALLKAMEGRKANGHALINCEDECYLAAALGLCAGVMRHPLHGLRPNDDWDLFFPHMVDDAKRRMDEVTRMVNWQEIMPPFGATEEPVQTDERVLEDFLSFSRGQTWMTALIGQTLVQRAPARVSRGMAMPEVNCDGEPPFVAASCHGTCAAVALLPRTRENRFMPLADLRIDLPHPVSHLAIFGSCRSLRIVGTGVRRAEARDLLGGEAVALSHCDGELTISGDMIRSIGLSGATPGDRSEPGLQITFLEG